MFFGGAIGLDPCSGARSRVAARVSYSLPDDGLRLPWDGFGGVWVNPPFGRAVVRWVERASVRGDETILCVPARTDAGWWCDHVWPRAAAICWVRGRVRYHDGRTGEIPRGCASTFPTALVLFARAERGEAFADAFAHLGHVTRGAGRLERQPSLPF